MLEKSIKSRRIMRRHYLHDARITQEVLKILQSFYLSKVVRVFT